MLEGGESLYSVQRGKALRARLDRQALLHGSGAGAAGPRLSLRNARDRRVRSWRTAGASRRLALVGGGDPNLSSRQLPYHPKLEFRKDRLEPMRELASQVAAAGVTAIEGDIVGDASRYVWDPYPPGWSLEDVSWGYGAPVSALAYNDNKVEVLIRPGLGASAPARLKMEPAIEYFNVRNLTRTATTRFVARRLRLRVAAPGSGGWTCGGRSRCARRDATWKSPSTTRPCSRRWRCGRRSSTRAEIARQRPRPASRDLRRRRSQTGSSPAAEAGGRGAGRAAIGAAVAAPASAPQGQPQPARRDVAARGGLPPPQRGQRRRRH